MGKITSLSEIKPGFGEFVSVSDISEYGETDAPSDIFFQNQVFGLKYFYFLNIDGSI